MLRGVAWSLFVVMVLSWFAPDYSGPFLTVAIAAPMALSWALDVALDRGPKVKRSR